MQVPVTDTCRRRFRSHVGGGLCDRCRRQCEHSSLPSMHVSGTATRLELTRLASSLVASEFTSLVSLSLLPSLSFSPSPPLSVTVVVFFLFPICSCTPI